MSKLKEMLKYIVPFLVAVFLFALITDFDKTWGFVSQIFGFIMFILSRFILGFSLAYILNFLVKFLQKRLRFPFWLAIVMSYVVFIGIIAGLIIYLVPYIVESINSLIKILPDFEVKARDFFQENLFGPATEDNDLLAGFFTTVSKQLAEFSSSVLDLPAIGTAVLSAGRTLIDLSFGFLISVYALIEKDSLLQSGKRVIYALSKGDKGEKRIKFLKEANQIYSQFIVGKFVDSLVIAAISAVLYAIFGLELIPFLVFVTFIFNMLPYFGPIIGSVIIILIMLFFSPLHAFYALIICVAVQALDGSVIGPKILGSAVGISPLLTIVAICVGGDLAGFLGIFLGIPTLAMLKVLVFDKYIKEKLAMKNISSDWPDADAPKERKSLKLPRRKK